MTQSQSPQPQGGMRSIFERMTAPTEADLAINARLSALKRPEVARIVDHMAQTMEHLAHQRNDLTVQRIDEDGSHGFTVRIDTSTPENPLIMGPKAPEHDLPRRSRGRKR